jgi:DNA-binding SARP family transcriptional activator/TolB-like protein
VIELRTLRRLDLRGPDRRDLTSLLAQPKRLALLAYLSIASPRGFHRRDSLLALFWPESDQEHARTSLRKALHVLRQTVGERTILSRGDEEIAIDREALWCDAECFDEALDRGAAEQALALYGGDLLTGLHVSMSSGFERWLEEERGRLRNRAHQAARTLARRAQAEGNSAGAAERLRQALTLQPDDESSVRDLIQLLDHIGERAAALREYDRFAERLALELEVDPAPETRACVAAIRARETAESGMERTHGLSTGGEAADPLRSRSPDTPIPPTLTAAAHPARRRRIAVAVGAGILAIGLVLAWPRGQTPDGAADARRLTRLAVLPFESVGDTADKVFAEGMHEEITTRLGRIPGLRLIARSSALQYRRSRQTAPEFGRELRVEYVLDGAVRSSLDPAGQKRVRITPELIRVGDGTQIWGEAYEGTLADVFRFQADVAQHVAEALRGTLGTPEQRAVRRAATGDLEAYRLNILGRAEWNHRTPGSLEKAVRYFQQAIARDSTYARPWAGLADAYALYGFYGVPSLSRDRAYSLAKSAALRAIALDPSLAEPHASLNQILRYGYWDWQGSEREVRRAIALDPSYATAHQWLAEHLENTGHSAEALVEATTAVQLDPLSIPVRNVLAWVLWDAGRIEEAIALFREAIAQDPTANRPRSNLYSLYLAQGRSADALAILTEAHDTSRLARAVVRAPHDPRARDSALKALARGSPYFLGSGGHYIAAELYAHLGAQEEALTELEQALGEGSPELESIKVDPFLASLRGTSRFAAVARKVGLPP